MLASTVIASLLPAFRVTVTPSSPTGAHVRKAIWVDNPHRFVAIDNSLKRIFQEQRRDVLNALGDVSASTILAQPLWKEHGKDHFECELVPSVVLMRRSGEERFVE
jgi:hypothetical protein